MSKWEPVIGLEIHVQLKTRTKMFCRCENVSGDDENVHTCPVCLAHPGALPVLNGKAIDWTIRLGAALGCTIAERAIFHRKNYFYQDLPKGYQISQYNQPLCEGGAVTVPRATEDLEVGITRAHLEEDAAKTIHVGGEAGRIQGASTSLVDFNRGGTPLVEIVTEPDLRSAEDSKAFLQLLRQTIVELGISDAEMEKGSLRCDANVSVRPTGQTELAAKTELKNMNSFSFVAKGVNAEIARQIAAYEAGKSVTQQTMHFDPQSGTLLALRTKEEAHDYRYFPEPDLVAIEPDADVVARASAGVGELPGQRIRRLEEELGFELAESLVTTGRDGLYERVEGDRRSVANVIMNQLAGAGIELADVGADELARLIEARERIPRHRFDEAIGEVGKPGFSAAPYLAEEAVADADALAPLIDAVLAEHAGQVEAYRGGKDGLLGFFVGQVMKATDGKANPRAVNELLREKLQG